MRPLLELVAVRLTAVLGAILAGSPILDSAQLIAQRRLSLSNAERSALVQKLSEEDRAWLLDYVAPIILPDEERLFLLVNEEHREPFKDEFWKRREKAGLASPLGPGYRRRYEELWRIVESSYDGWRQDAGRMVIAHGEPSSIENVTDKGCGDLFRNLEIWTYADAAAGGSSLRHEFFFRVAPGAPRKLWTYGDADSDLLQPGSCRRSLADLQRWECPPPRDMSVLSDRCAPACPDACRVILIWNELMARHGSGLGGRVLQARALAPPEVPLEDLVSLASRFPEVPAQGSRLVRVESTAQSGAVINGQNADTSTSKGFGTASATGSSVLPKLTERQRTERLRDLPAEERTWLEDYVSPIILAAERDLFLQLTADYQRQMFKREFWARRERAGLPPPLGPGYETRYAQLRETAEASYEGTSSDAGRMVVRKGEPAGIESLLACSEVYRQAEIWSYPGGEKHLFYRPSFGAPRRLWISGDPAIFQTSSCVASFDEACAMRGSGPRRECPSVAIPKTCRDACTVAAVAAEIDAHGLREGSLIAEPPAISTEGLEGLWLRLASVSTPGARAISLGGATRPPAAPDEPPEPAPAWSNEKIRDAILALPKKYRDWIDLAAPLVTRPELVEFLRLRPGDRDAWVRRFWKRHGHVD